MLIPPSDAKQPQASFPWWFLVPLSLAFVTLWLAFSFRAVETDTPNEARLRTLLHDPKALKEGHALFVENCTTCHGSEGHGGQGPNLRDDYWLKGSNMRDIVRSIENGNGFLGMPSWKKYLPAKKIYELAAYVATLGGTNNDFGQSPFGKREPITYR